MEKQIKEDVFNNYTTMSIYDFLDESILTGYKHRLVGFITPKQRVFDIADKRINDETLMEQDMAREIYQSDETTQILGEDVIKLYSGGKSLSVEFPSEITEEQLECLQDVLRQVRSFEYDYDRTVYMPLNSREIMAVAKTILTESKESREEKIIGTPLKGKSLTKTK